MMSILYNIIIAPIELLVEIIFELIYRLVGQRITNQGLAVIGVSIAISLLTFPLYYSADKVQQKQRDLQQKLSYWINHIKKTFKGDERFMMLQTYYRQNNYSPISALNGSISLLLEIPFFIAAYHFLSNLEVLKGAHFFIISDLGQPDQLIKIGGLSINLLPILMTTINCVSSAIYLKGFPIKDKIQTYGMALIFLVLLYNSPSGLVVYWTCNNLFSLVKNVFYKLKNPRFVFVILCFIFGILFPAILIPSGILNSKKKYVAVFVFSFFCFIPLIIYVLKKINIQSKFNRIKQFDTSSSKTLFFLTSAFIVILMGILIPSSVISSSPAEFVNIQNYKNPLFYLVNSACYALGFFFFWSCIIRYMLPESKKYIFDLVFVIISGVFLVNYMCFGRHLGTLSPMLQFTDGIRITTKIKILNLLCILILVFVLSFVFRYKKILKYTFSIFTISIAFISIVQIAKTNKQLSKIDFEKTSSTAKEGVHISLSQNGKNVIVFMLDRAISGYVPYIFEEKPELKEQFKGFTYYPNTLSHGFFTNFGSPALFGGYEYTPTEMNKRSSESLENKHNEALKVLPVLFDQNNFEVTVIDPPYAGYTWIPDLSIYKDYPEIKSYIASGNVLDDDLLSAINYDAVMKRNFFCYSIFKTFPLAFSTSFYSSGSYLSSKDIINSYFYKEYSVLKQLTELTTITNQNENNFLMIQNSTTHENCELQLPDYTFTANVNNSKYNQKEKALPLTDLNQVSHYHVNMASLLMLGKWFDYMKDNNVYDNTRIILVADHGRGLNQFDYMQMKNPEINVEWCNPLLMVKDFYSEDFNISNEFMTNGDTPSIAVKDIIEKPLNPFTGKEINEDEKTAHPQIITSSLKFKIEKDKRTVFDTSDGHWYSVHDNIFDESNWKLVE